MRKKTIKNNGLFEGPKIQVRTLPNGYSLDVDGEGFMYYTAEELVAGFAVRVGFKKMHMMKMKDVKAMMKTFSNGTTEKMLQQEINELRERIQIYYVERRSARKIINS